MYQCISYFNSNSSVGLYYIYYFSVLLQRSEGKYVHAKRVTILHRMFFITKMLFCST